MKLKLYKDTIHGLHAESGSKTTAWGLIRAYCHENGLEVPTMDKITIVKDRPKRKPKVVLTKPETGQVKDIGGRPTKYKPEYEDQVYKLCLLGATDAEIANFFEVSESTVNLWKLEHEGFSESIRAGKCIADMEVSVSLYQTTQDRAVKKQIPIKVKKRTPYIDSEGKPTRSMIEEESVQIVEVEEIIPADFRSQQFWLKNRKPDKWRDKQEIEHYDSTPFLSNDPFDSDATNDGA